MPITELLSAAQDGCKTTTDAGLARCLNVTKQAVSSWRRGASFPDWDACRRISKVSGLDLSSVLETVSIERLKHKQRVARGMKQPKV